ncbi:Hypothetical predicted protein [Pelobates cultripes]|uniref:Reverse transcriptase n=1 Tax=Pelobates cultripes TaxID=61616 RepID=A0AAD1WHK1_PELCU|nr:Hypothetical predicted protein [Pelobates cultripes]
MQSSRYKMYLSLLGRLDVLISQGGDPEDIAAVKALMRSYQYDRYASLVKERDHGSCHSPDPYLSCKRKEGTKTISGLRGTNGILEESPHGILKVVRDYYIELLGKGSPRCAEGGKSRGREVDNVLNELTLPEHSDLSFDELISEITILEVTESIHQQNKCKSPGPDGLTAEFYQQFCDLLAPHLTEVFNESLAQGLLPPSMRTSALILLTKPNVLDTADVGNWRPISLLNVDRKVLAKILMKRVQGLARRILSTSQYCTIGGRTVFDAVFEEATEVDDLILAYSAASTSRINRDKSGVFWCGKEGDQFPLPDGFPRAQSEIKILGVIFGPGDLALRNWSERLAIASSKVEESHRWKLTYREQVKLIKTYVLTVFGYVSNIFLLPRSLHARMFALFFRMLWGNRLHLIKRGVTYLARKDGAWGWKVKLDKLQASLAFGDGKVDTRSLSWTEHQALSRQKGVGVPQGATAHTRADIQLLSGLLAECKELASNGLHFLERPPPSLETEEGPGDEVVPETPPEVASTSEAPQASLTYAAAAKGEGVEARALRGLPSDRLWGLLVSLKAQHAEADSGLAGVQAELREQREKSSRTSNHKRGPVRAIIAQKKLEEQRLS